MTDVEFDTTEPTLPDDLEIPATLPILPLKEMVVFPDSATPLAIGQERSIALIDDVVARIPRSSRPAGTTSTGSAPRRSSTS